MTTLPQLSHALITLLTTTADRLAAETGFVQRVSRLTGSLFARILVFSWWADPAATCAARADMAATLGCPVSKQALDQRFGPASAAFLRALLGAAVQVAVAADPVAVPVLRRFTHVEVCDGSVITLPDSLASLWPGCGHVAQDVTAAVKLVLRCDLVTGQLRGPVLVSGRTADRTGAAELAPLPAGSLHLADLGFFALEQFRAWAAADCYWLSRWRRGTAVYDRAGRRLDLLPWLRQHCPQQCDVPILLGAPTRLPGRLLAERVPAAVAAERRARLRAAASREQRLVSTEEWALAEWTILVTNCPAEQLSLDEALALAAARWQIELLFKRWKSLGQVDEWRTANRWRILTEIYAKLLLLVLQHWVLVVGSWARPERSLWQGVQALQARGRCLARAWGQGHWTQELAEALAALARCRIDKRRNEPSTYQRLLAAAPPAVQLKAA